jgi:hypothetical protein
MTRVWISCRADQGRSRREGLRRKEIIDGKLTCSKCGKEKPIDEFVEGIDRRCEVGEMRC